MKRNIVRKAVENLEAYNPAVQKAKALLNANENPYNLPEDIRKEISDKLINLDYNRYPDPLATELSKTYGDMVDIPINQIMVGNGSDDLLEIITNTFVDPGDIVISHTPSFSMYKIWTDIAGGEFIEIEDHPDHSINMEKIKLEAQRKNAKLVYICSPNNPTGFKVSKADLQDLLESTPSLIVLDEAYIEFDGESLIEFVKAYDNIIVLRTLSKAYRMPAARCGFAFAPVEIIEEMRKVKAPYNVNSLTQEAAKIVLDHREELQPAIEEIKEARDEAYNLLKDIKGLTVYPSHANFLYVVTPEDEKLQEAFLAKGISVRYFPNDHAFRITIGTPEENKLVIDTIKEVFE